MRRRVAVMAALIGCAESRFTLTHPEGVDENSKLVVAIESEGERIFAVPAKESLTVAVGPSARITILERRNRPDEFPFPFGEVTPGECALLDEARPDRSYTGTFDPEGPDSLEWTELGSEAELTPFVRSFRVRVDGGCREDPCSGWDVKAFELSGSKKGVAWSVELPDRRALLGTYDQHVYVVDESGDVAPVDLVPATQAIRSAALDGGGQLWLGGAYHVFRGRLDAGGLILESATPFVDDVYGYITAGTSTTGEGLFALTDRGSFLRRSGQDWSTVSSELSSAVARNIRRGGLARVGPEEVVVVWSLDPIIWRFRAGQLIDESPSRMSQGGSAAAYLRGWGTMVGTVETGLLYDDHEGVFRLHDEQLGSGARAIVPLAGGFLIGSEYSIQEYVIDHGLCPPLYAIPTGVRTLLVRASGTVLVGSDSQDGGPAAVAVLTRRVGG